MRHHSKQRAAFQDGESECATVPGRETWVSFKIKGRAEGRGKSATRQDGKVRRGQLRQGLADHGRF